MPGLSVFPRGEVLLSDLRDNRLDTARGQIAVGAIARDEGAPVVLLAIPTTWGRWIIGETDLALFLTAAESFVAVHGDPRRRGVTFEREGPNEQQ